MSKIFLFLLLCAFAFASVPNNTKQEKRDVSNDGWIGLSNPYGYGYGYPWSESYKQDHNRWKGFELPEANLHAGLHLTDIHDFSTYDGDSINLTPGIVKALPIYTRKRAAVPEKSKAKSVPKQVITEKPHRVPMEKTIPVPIEKILHKPVTVAASIPQLQMIPMRDPIMQQPDPPISVEHPVPIPIPLPIPLPVHPLQLFATNNGLHGAIYEQSHALDHFYSSPPQFIHLPSPYLDHGYRKSLSRLRPWDWSCTGI